MSEAPSPWSATLPNLQLAWDATSLNALQFCPTFYRYSIIEGYRASGVNLEFGGYFASAVEVYKKARVAGKGKLDAQVDALRYVTEVTWVLDPNTPETVAEGESGKPWSGSYVKEWRCSGEKPYKNAKGNRAKCPYSHKGMWFPEPAPGICGECGSHVEEQNHWVPLPDYKVKNRYSLIRLVAWWTEEQPENLQDGLAPIKLPDGRAAVELSFKMPLPWKAGTGESFLLTGHMDDISSIGGETFVVDNKTTSKPLTPRYWDGYAPNSQVDTYDLVGSTLFAEADIRGMVIDAAQVSLDGARFGRHILHRTEGQREEWLREMEWWMQQAETFARSDYWPMNRAHCWSCDFKGVCSKDPSKREAILKGNFQVRKWNPLEER